MITMLQSRRLHRLLTGLGLLTGLFSSLIAPSVVRGQDTIAYQVAQLWPGDAPPIDDAVLVVEDGRIRAVGSATEVSIPENAQRKNFGPGSVLVPGLVAAQSGIGETSRDDERTLTPEVRAIDGFDPYQDFEPILEGGVTTVQLSPGRSRLIPGVGAVVKLSRPTAGGPEPILRDVGDLRILLTRSVLNPPRIYDPPPRVVSGETALEPTRPQLGGSLAGALTGLKLLLESATDNPPQAWGPGGPDPVLVSVAQAIDATGRLRIEAPDPPAIRAALALAREYRLRLVLVGVRELRPFLDELDDWAELVDGVVLGPGTRPGVVTSVPIRPEFGLARRDPWDDAVALTKAGIPVAIVPEADADLDDLLFLGGLFTAGPLTDQQVLEMMTFGPAKILGVQDRVGSLQPGKDADFVLLTDAPFDVHALVREVYLGGESVWSADKAEEVSVIRGGTILTGDGTVVADGSIAVRGSKIRGVGTDVSAPPTAGVRVFEDAFITPGFIDFATDLGFGGSLSSGGSTRTSVQLGTSLGDRLISNDPAVSVAREGGITTVLTGPRDNSPAPVIAFKLGDQPNLLGDLVAIRFRLSGNLTSTTPALRTLLTRGKQYADSWTKYEADLKAYEVKKREYDQAKARLEAEKRAAEARRKAEEAKKEADDDDNSEKEEKSESEGGNKATITIDISFPQEDDDDSDESEKKEESEESEKSEDKDDDDSKKDDEKGKDQAALPKEPEKPKEPRKVDNQEPYRLLFGGKIPALVDVDQLEAIRDALKVFRDEFKLDTVLLGAEDAFRDLDKLSEAKAAAVVGPRLIQTVDQTAVNLAEELALAGIPFAFQSESRTGSASLSQAIRYAVRYGLGTDDALAGLSSQPAALIKLQERIGTITIGKDADLVVWSGPPFDLSSRVLAVMIDGEWVYEVEADTSKESN